MTLKIAEERIAGDVWTFTAIDADSKLVVSWLVGRGKPGKIYGNDPEGQKRYSPAQCLGTQRNEIVGDPDPRHISTSFVEAAEFEHADADASLHPLDQFILEKIQNHIATVALFHMYYDFARVHQTLRVTPAMEAGISSHVWSIQEIVALVATRFETLAA